MIPQFFRFIQQSKYSNQPHHQDHRSNNNTGAAGNSHSGILVGVHHVSSSGGKTANNNGGNGSSGVGGGLVKEWSISNSTLEEVFLRLCSAEKNVNELAVDFGKQHNDISNDNNDIELQQHKLKPICILCNIREAQEVTLYSRTGVMVQCSNVICMPCCMGPDYTAKIANEEKEKKELDHTNTQQQDTKDNNGHVGNDRVNDEGYPGGMFDDDITTPVTIALSASPTTVVPVAMTVSDDGNEEKKTSFVPLSTIVSPPMSPLPLLADTAVAHASSSPSPSPSPALTSSEKVMSQEQEINNSMELQQQQKPKDDETLVNGKPLTNAVGVRPPTWYQQIRAIVLKNIALVIVEKKQWIFKLV
jgi:hypothetical protein